MSTTKCSQKGNRDSVVDTCPRPVIAAMAAWDRQGRKTSHRFFYVNDDDISNQKVYKNELKEGANSGGL